MEELGEFEVRERTGQFRFQILAITLPATLYGVLAESERKRCGKDGSNEERFSHALFHLHRLLILEVDILRHYFSHQNSRRNVADDNNRAGNILHGFGKGSFAQLWPLRSLALRTLRDRRIPRSQPCHFKKAASDFPHFAPRE